MRYRCEADPANCDLRFWTEPERDEHERTDHPEEPAVPQASGIAQRGEVITHDEDRPLARAAAHGERFACEEVTRETLAVTLAILDDMIGLRGLSYQEQADAILTGLTGVPAPQVLLRVVTS